MADVHVTQDPIVVYAIVVAIGALVVIALLFSFFGSRMPRTPTQAQSLPPATGDA